MNMGYVLKKMPVLPVFLAVFTGVFLGYGQNARAASNVIINEVDADTVSYDTEEFIELFDGGSGYTDLSGLVLVLYNGSNDTVYQAYDLDGYTTDASGYFVLGSVSQAGLYISPGSSGWLQNGADAVALYEGDADAFPSGTPITSENIVDALVYDTNDSDDSGLLVLLNPDQAQINEGGNGDKDNHSNQRCPNGSGGALNTQSYIQAAPTPGTSNACGSSYTTIYDIQYTAESSGDSPLKNQSGITTQGIVTAIFSSGYFIEDASGGAWNGLFIYDTNTPDIGDLIQVTGTVTEYYNLTELTSLTNYTLVSSGNTRPDPVVVSTLNAGREQYEGVLVRVEGVDVTREADGNGEWTVSDGSGDVIIDDKGSYTYSPVLGDTLSAVVGPLDYSFGSFKILPRDDGDITDTSITVNASVVINEILADPASDTDGDANGDGTRDSSQDEFVEIVNTSDTDFDISGWTLSDGYGIRHIFPENTVVPAQCAVIVFGGGTPTGTFGGVTVQTASTGALGLNNSGDTITLNDGETEIISVSYGSEGGNNQSLVLAPDLTGTWTLHSAASESNGTLFSPGTRSDGTAFSGCADNDDLGECGGPATLIHDIQGSGTTSPEEGNVHIIEGIVVGDFQTGKALSGFFVQEEDSDADANPATSEGIFIYDGTSPSLDVSVGDKVRVRGRVTEYYDLTEMTDVSIKICSSEETVTAAEVSLPLDTPEDWERYEGMLITIPQVLYVTDNYTQGRYGEVGLSVNNRLFTPTNVVEPGDKAIALQAENDRSRIQLEDGCRSENPEPAAYMGEGNTLRVGDTTNGVTGVISYSYSTYELHPTQEVSFTRMNVRDTLPPSVGGTLRVASFNVLNYFVTLDNNGAICGPTQDMDCRGADTAEEFTRQRDKIINAISALDADIVGLMEIENHPDDAALQNLVDGLNGILGENTYAFVKTGPIGTDAIKVGFIYKPSVARLYGDFAVLDSSVDADFNDSLNRPALAQTFQEAGTGEKVTVVVNHLKSKGSACDDIGDPDTGDGQGNCNLTRTAAAQALVSWLATDPTKSSDEDFLIIGDLNSYAMEDPIDAIKSGGYTDLLSALPEPYSYTYEGQSGYLDHALANTHLAGQVAGVVHWHINADEPAALDYNDYNQTDLYTTGPFRASDHDPVLIGLSLASQNVTGDLDEDGDVDRDDVNIISSFRRQPASACPECDIDGDGTITILDARKAVGLCTLSGCVRP